MATNIDGKTAHLSFGMDNQYKCELEVWGSTGSIMSQRIFTAPPDYNVPLTIQQGQERREVIVQADDQFYRAIEAFGECINSKKSREEAYVSLKRQSEYLDQVQALANAM